MSRQFEPMEDYPFPLANGQVAILRLPIKLERADMLRMLAYIEALVAGDAELHSVRADLRERSQS